MKNKDFIKIIKAHPKGYRSDVGIYSVWGNGDQLLIQPFTEREIDCKKYQYNLLTDRWVAVLKAVKASDDLLQIEWEPKVIRKGKHDETQYDSEEMPEVSVKELCNLFKLDPQKYPFDGKWYSVTSKYQNEMQKKIKHPLDFDKYEYCITNSAKMIDCEQWDKW